MLNIKCDISTIRNRVKKYGMFETVGGLRIKTELCVLDSMDVRAESSGYVRLQLNLRCHAVPHNKLLGGKKSPHRTVLYVTHCSEQMVASTSCVMATLCLALTAVFLFIVPFVV
ncbi:hypothetical protein GOODEAATRI_017985 [Goodea atripinnis]|uniref:Uncharacterized protein n=1 Tax=Goodea atripinnis TaxID=208336 RepID=A0ABV0PZ39_9TELE